VENAAIRNNVLEIRMKYLDSASPAALGFNADQRVLAVAIHDMKIDLN